MSEALAFRDFVDGCLYDPRFGYYGAGVVRFGDEAHYSTFPQGMSPAFGWLVADSLAWLLDAPMRDGRIPPDAPLTLLEIGAGDGALARDTLDRLVSRAGDPRLGPLAERIRYVVGDRSPTLRERQRRALAPHIEAGRAEVIALDARAPRWEGPFYGAVVCNELLSNLACDKLILHRGGGVTRVGVTARPPMSADTLWRAVAAGEALALEETTVPLAPDPARDALLAALAPLIADAHALGHDPLPLYYNAGVPAFVDGLASILAGPDRFGLALLVDYGGTSRHVLDPRFSHLRVYGRVGAESPLETPGQLDITWDLDFTQLGLVAEERGLELLHLGHQSMLESVAADLWGPELRPLVVEGRVAEGAAPGEEAELEAERLVAEFREADGFRAVVLGPPGVEVPRVRFGESDPWRVDALVTIAPWADRRAMGEAVADLALPPPDEWLYPGCDLVANISAVEAYAERATILERLAPFLARPGEIARRG
ncbi:MAG: SAM-dependent methyltransferase [Sandaracinaceae bacterium]|nr:SAM-dependent methyltransferase [Sandaracinaceae bacterium]